MTRRALTVQELVCAHTHPTLQDPATTRIRARVYRSRYPTLRTVRITGSGEVWVDGLLRRGRRDRLRRVFVQTGLEVTLTDRQALFAIATWDDAHDAMEVVR